jgi:DNA-binding MarR family transcriptional regulator
MNAKNAGLAGIVKYDRALRQSRAAIDPLVSSQLIQAFLAVALHEGQTLTEIADSLGANLSTASRQLLDLGDRNRKREPGYGLVEVVADPMNLRINRYSLTPKGKLIIREINQIIEENNGHLR